MLQEKITEDSVKQLVDAFYRKVRQDALLAPVFEGKIGSENETWDHHLKRMHDFWSSIMLTSGRYHGSPFKKHLALPPFDLTLFERWLALFAETAYEMHSPDTAMLYIKKSTMIAQSLKLGLSPHFQVPSISMVGNQ